MAVRHIFRWDLDKTYLKTEFATLRDLVRTARLTAEQRENIPGSAALLKAIRDAAPADGQHLVFFISGSPEQLRTVIEKKFALDGFVPDGFVLKPAVSNLLRGRFRVVTSQVPYKLKELLLGRAEAPVGTRETLFGDDAENDAFIYSLYADIVNGRVNRELVRKILKKTGAYQNQIDEIDAAMDCVVREDPVSRVVIHLDQRTPPAAFAAFFPRVVPIYNHLQTALVLHLDDILPAVGIRLVARELLDRYGFETNRLINLAEDILRRRRIHYPLERLSQLAEVLQALEAEPIADDGLERNTQSVIRGIAERAQFLRHRPLPEDSGRSIPATNYEALWDAEQARKEELKRAKKLASKISRDDERALAAQLEQAGEG